MQILDRQSTRYQKENTLMQTALLGIDENAEMSSAAECKDVQDTATISRNKTKQRHKCAYRSYPIQASRKNMKAEAN
jgi:hypothetical protein